MAAPGHLNQYLQIRQPADETTSEHRTGVEVRVEGRTVSLTGSSSKQENIEQHLLKLFY